ncbi:MAG: hypothetical protein JXA18_17030 [Chitinispirillaceae bacterium]|nr:hypothetical protein [Chitinispirillaceae bacterium]
MKTAIIVLCAAVISAGNSGSYDSRAFGGYKFVPQPISDSTVHLYVYEIDTNEVVCQIVLKNLNTRHYHPYEFHNGILYVILCNGGKQGDMSSGSINELWKFDRGRSNTLLFSAPGLDFRVSPDNNIIAATDGSALNPNGGHLLFINSGGMLIRRLSVRDFAIEDFGDLYLTNSQCYFTVGGPESCIDRLYKIDLGSFNWTVDKLHGLSFCEEYDFNAVTETVIGSDFPQLFDQFDEEAMRVEQTPVTLWTYCLKTGQREVVSTSTAKRFNPQWLNDSIVGFDDPAGDIRLRINMYR